jgi:hypothetical protein
MLAAELRESEVRVVGEAALGWGFGGSSWGWGNGSVSVDLFTDTDC